MAYARVSHDPPILFFLFLVVLDVLGCIGYRFVISFL